MKIHPKFYLIKCIGMQRADRVKIKNFQELIAYLDRYAIQFGPIEFIINDDY